MIYDVLREELNEVLKKFPYACVKSDATTNIGIWVDIKNRDKLIIYSPLVRHLAIWDKGHVKMKMYASQELSNESLVSIPEGYVSIQKVLDDYQEDNNSLPNIPPIRL